MDLISNFWPNDENQKIFQKPNSAIWNFAEKSGPEIWKSSKGMNEDNEWSVNERKSQGPVIFKSRISLWTTNYLKKIEIFEIFPVWKFRAIQGHP